MKSKKYSQQDPQKKGAGLLYTVLATLAVVVITVVLLIPSTCKAVEVKNFDNSVAKDQALGLKKKNVKKHQSMMDVNYKALVSRADLHFTKRVHPQGGLPIGNGRFGTLVWLSDSAVKFQINRNDVFYSNSYKMETEFSPDCYSACGWIDIDCGKDVFSGPSLKQYLSAYDALGTITGNGVTARILAWSEGDVLAVEIIDNREVPQPIQIDLRMHRKPEVRKKNWTARSSFVKNDGRMELHQIFEEPAFSGLRKGDHYCATALSLKVVGRQGTVQTIGDQTLRLSLPAKKGRVVLYAGSAAELKKDTGVKNRARMTVDAAAKKGFEKVEKKTQAWWHAFWERSFVHMNSTDPQAIAIEEIYTWHMYIMACISRGQYPAKFNGLLFGTGGGVRSWGGFFWGINTIPMYFPMLMAGHDDLARPYYDLYRKNLATCKRAARQLWQAEGAFIAETMPFSGSDELPEAIGKEMSDFFLCRTDKPSQELIEFVNKADHLQPHYNGSTPGKLDRFSFVTHIFNSGAKVAQEFWRQYQHNLDRTYLKEQAYPIIRGVSEFFRTHPQTFKEKDGKYHTHRGNTHEPVWDIRDSGWHIASIRGILPLAISASKILGVDEELRRKWQEMLDNLTHQPLSTDPDMVPNKLHPEGKTVWVNGRKPVGRILNTINGQNFPLWFDGVTLETAEANPKEWAIAQASHEANHCRNMWLDGKDFCMLRGAAIDAAWLGRGEELRKMLPPCGISSMGQGLFANRLSGKRTRNNVKDNHSVQNSGVSSYAIQLGLLQSNPPKFGADPVIRVAPAWTRVWDADFALHTRHGFKVASSIKKGIPRFVEVTSKLGGICRIRNPWPGKAIDLYRNGKKEKSINGDLHAIKTSKNDTLVLVPKGADLASLRVTVCPIEK